MHFNIFNCSKCMFNMIKASCWHLASVRRPLQTLETLLITLCPRGFPSLLTLLHLFTSVNNLFFNWSHCVRAAQSLHTVNLRPHTHQNTISAEYLVQFAVYPEINQWDWHLKWPVVHQKAVRRHQPISSCRFCAHACIRMSDTRTMVT